MQFDRLLRALTSGGVRFVVVDEEAGGGTYDRLVDPSDEVVLGDLTVRLVDLPTLVGLKRAAGRPRDLGEIAELEALLEEGG